MAPESGVETREPSALELGWSCYGLVFVLLSIDKEPKPLCARATAPRERSNKEIGPSSAAREPDLLMTFFPLVEAPKSPGIAGHPLVRPGSFLLSLLL